MSGRYSRQTVFGRVFVFTAAVLGLMAATQVSAHSLWKLGSITPPRTTDLYSYQKTPPCGGLPRGNSPVSFTAGSTITVEWVESIQHNGYFQIWFSEANDANFVQLMATPTGSATPMLDIPDNQNGALAPGAVHEYSAQITLPNTPCTDCVLRLIQVMVSNNTESYYYSCSDIQLLANNPADVTPPADVSGLAVSPGDTQAMLNWSNPVADFNKVLLLRDSATITDIPNTGTEYQVGDVIGSSTVVYAGNGEAFNSTGLGNGNSYYFKAFAYDLNKNYAAGVEVSTTLPDPPVNVVPQTQILVTQGINDTPSVEQDGGQVVIQALVTDGNPADVHDYDWSSTDVRLMDMDADPATLTIDPATLSAGSYPVAVTVNDNGTPMLNSSDSVTLVVNAPASTNNPVPANTGSGGGCTLSSGSGFAPLLPLMLFITSAYLFLRSLPLKPRRLPLRPRPRYRKLRR